MRSIFCLKKHTFLAVFRSFFCVFCILFLTISPFYLFHKENYKLNLNEYFDLENSTKVVLTIHHIETFEGGTASREKYLMQQTVAFNKMFSNCFIVIKTLSPDQLALNIRNNNLPDLYSFGVGCGDMVRGFLCNIKNSLSVRNDLLENGKANGELLAYPYILSGYVLISHDNLTETDETLSALCASNGNNLGISVANNYNFAEVLTQNNITLKQTDILEAENSYDAYKNFLEKKSKTLLGTARDLARIKNRESLGTIDACKYNFLGSYTDLVQYISVVDSGKSAKMLYAKKFAEFLTTSPAQKSLSNFGLFSTTQNIYKDDYMRSFESALSGKLSTPNAFISAQDLLFQTQQSKEKLFTN